MPWLLLFALLLPALADNNDRRIDDTVTQDRQRVYADLDAAIDAALAQKKPLICFVGIKPTHDYVGCVVCHLATTELYPEEVIVYEVYATNDIQADNKNQHPTEGQILKAVARVKASIEQSKRGA